MKLHHICVALACMLIACDTESVEEIDGDTSAVSADDTVTLVPMPLEGDRAPGFDSANAPGFQRMVFQEFAHQAVRVPKREMDSILMAVGPERAQTVLGERMQRQADVVRQQLAEKYGVTVDSIRSIIEIGEQMEW